MTLGPEDVQTAELADVIAFLAADLAVLGDEVVVALGRLVRRSAVGEQVLAGQAFGVPTKDDVDAAAGHVRGDGHGVRTARLGDDRRLAFVLLRVQDGMGDPTLVEDARQLLRLFDRDRADQHRLTLFVALGDVVGDRLEL